MRIPSVRLGGFQDPGACGPGAQERGLEQTWDWEASKVWLEPWAYGKVSEDNVWVTRESSEDTFWERPTFSRKGRSTKEPEKNWTKSEVKEEDT